MAHTKLAIFAFLILATAMEVTGDAVVRMGLGQSATMARLIYFACGAALLFGYGLALNSAPIEFEKVVGIYVVMVFAMWQIVSAITFHTLPNIPILVGGGLIIVGGLIVAFWQPGTAGQSLI